MAEEDVRQHFDRFGDDLCELILSYFPISDCFKYECVSKQWKRVLFNSRQQLIIGCDVDIDDRHRMTELSGKRCNREDYVRINDCLLECALQKCARINSIIVESNIKISEETFAIIADNCPLLNSLIIRSNLDDISEMRLTEFGEKCGPKMIEFYFANSYPDIYSNFRQTKKFSHLLSLMPNLKSIICGPNLLEDENQHLNLGPYALRHLIDNSYADILINDTLSQTEYLPKLEQINCEIIADNHFRLFADRFYGKLLKLKVRLITRNPKKHGVVVIRNTENKINANESLRQLSRFSSLESLTINATYIESDTVNIALASIGVNCVKLKTLVVFGLKNLNVFHNFRNGYELLETLRLDMHFCIVINCNSLYGIEGCVSLKRFMLIQTAIKENVFKDIHTLLPQLRALRVEATKISPKIFAHLSKMENLRTLMIETYSLQSDITDHDICSFIDNCLAIKKIGIKGQSNVSKENLNDFVRMSRRNINII